MPAQPTSSKIRTIIDLKKLGFPESVVDTLTNRGFVELNPIQQVSSESGLLDGDNQLIVAPTSSGKTLIAELASVHHALHRKGVFYLVSLKALAEEKYSVFKRFWTGGDEQILRTAITTGDRDFEDEGLSQTQVTFATYEKFYALIRDNPNLLSHVSLIVIDELQTLGDSGRGAVLEMLLTLVMVRNPKIQLIGLSAALPNADEVGSWLGAKICRTKTRDVPLIEEVWTKTTIFSKQLGQGSETLQQKPNDTSSVESLDIVHKMMLAKQTPIVVFCMTKPRTEQLAQEHYRRVSKISATRKILNEIKQLLLFFTEGGPTGRSLMDVVDAGIAFHHSDLSADERRVIEDKIRDGSIDVTYSTTTLGQGVNLPIATVIFDDVYRRWKDEFIDKREYINMAGRAGRRGLQDDKGTAILICRSAKDRVAMRGYFSEETERIESVLEHESLDTIVLNLVASSDASSVEELRTFIRKSFFGSRSAERNPKLLQARLDAVPEVAEQLRTNRFIMLNSEGRYRATPMGYTTSQKGISPKTALTLIRRMKALAKMLNESGDQFSSTAQELVPGTIHLLLDADENSGSIFYDATAVGYLMPYHDKICAIRKYEDPDNHALILQIAWVLSEWIQGTGYQNLCKPFRRLREGQIKQTAEHCSWMFDAAGALARLPDVGFDIRISSYLSVIAKRLLFGVPETGVALSEVVRNRIALGVELNGVGRGRIMDLLRAGYDDLTKIVEAEDANLAGVLRSVDQARNLKLGVARYVDRLARSMLAIHTIRSKKFSCDEIVARVYDELGTAFEIAVHDLLQAIGAKPELLDERKTQGCADILVATAAGNIEIECKTRAKGLVTNAEAFEVMGKTIVGPKPIAYVTIGKPGFVDVAIKNSYSNGVTLISHKILVEAAIMVLEKRKSLADFFAVFQLNHFVEKNDLR